MHQSFLFDINQSEEQSLPVIQTEDDKPKKGKECPQCKKLVGCRSNTCKYCNWNFKKIETPSLFGLKNTNRDFSNPDTWGKNQFNNCFPTSLACYMHSRKILPVYLKLSNNLEVSQ